MGFRIDPRLFATFPGVLLGVVVARDLDNRGADPALAELLRAAEARVRQELAGAVLSEHPRIAPWREAYRRFGVTPKRATSSIENLLRRVLRGEPVRHVNRLVDLYNVVSLRHLLPAGGEDLARIEGEVQLTFAGADETSITLLGEAEARPPHPGEVIYKDAVGPSAGAGTGKRPTAPSSPRRRKVPSWSSRRSRLPGAGTWKGRWRTSSRSSPASAAAGWRPRCSTPPGRRYAGSSGPISLAPAPAWAVAAGSRSSPGARGRTSSRS